MNREAILRQRIKRLTLIFILGLVVSGATAIPLRWELDLLAKLFGIADQSSSAATNETVRWLLTIS